MTAEQLKKIRKERGLSQRQAAKELGITQGRMSQLESGYYSNKVPDYIEDKVIALWNPSPEVYYVPLPVPAPKNEGYIEDDIPRDAHGVPLSCHGCAHRAGKTRNGTCNYILDTGYPRGCYIKNCRHYKRGPREDNKNDWVTGYHIG